MDADEIVEAIKVVANGRYDKMDAVVIHGNCQKEAEEWLAQLATTYPNVNFKLSYFGPVIGTHLGEGAMGLGWTKK
ncbi:hypothetical protein LSPH24S_05715 [Lysinibacillus sphaericus]